MSLQTPSPTSSRGIPSGFGQRLKEERKRLKLTQTELGEAGGVGRLAQIQYESEVTAPTTRYLAGISAVGADLSYLVLGIRLGGTAALTAEQIQRVEGKAFDWIEAWAQKQPQQQLSAETRRTLFQLFRSVLTRIELGELPADFDPTMLIDSQAMAGWRR